jgi:hypothetical protein
MRAAAVLSVLILAAPALGQEAPEPIRVTFQLNDALLKDRVLSGATVSVSRAGGDVEAEGLTDASGRLEVTVRPGSYLVSYTLKGYVSIEASPTELSAPGQLVTTTLSMNLESEGLAPDTQRIKLILNWGADRSKHAEDVDSHLACPCAGGGHVYFGSKTHRAGEHEVSLDVDDMDWGGPETVKLLRPVAGSYVYWVNDYSAAASRRLVDSDVVVRLVIGDEQVAEYRARPEHGGRIWRPFKTLEVADGGGITVVPFSDAELATAADEVLPALLASIASTTTPLDDEDLFVCGLWLLIGVGFLVSIVRRARRRT